MAKSDVLEGHEAASAFDGCPRSTELVTGERRLRTFFPAIQQLRLRHGLEDDLTTDPQYFIAANKLRNKRVAVVLIHKNGELEACVLFVEYCAFGISLGLIRGGDDVGDGLVVGSDAFRMQYIQLATQTLLKRWRIYGVSFTVRSTLQESVNVLGPAGKYRSFSERNTQHKLPLENTYGSMLASMGSRTRRSLAGKRQQLEERAQVSFVPSLEPDQALDAMLTLASRSLPKRLTSFYHARHRLLRETPDSFSMGMILPDGQWLSVLSGWRRHQVTYIDLQMNDLHYKKESLSAVMRAFMLEQEIGRRQTLINFVGGTSLLLRRYCRPIEVCTDVFLWHRCFRTSLFKLVIPHLRLKRAERAEQNRGVWGLPLPERLDAPQEP